MKTTSIASATLPPMIIRPAAMLAILLLAGCTSTPGEDAAQLRTDAAQRLAIDLPGDAETSARIDELLGQTLTREHAVLVALLNNPGMQRRYAQLEISAAERVAASRPPNPQIAFARLNRGNERETGRAISIDLIGLLTWPFEGGAARRAYAGERSAALREALMLARETRDAWVDAVAAGHRLRYAQDLRDAADTGREYAQRLADVGNGTQLDAARASALQAEAEAVLISAAAAALADRERLAILLGVADSNRIQLPAELPPLPEEPLPAIAAEQYSIDQRLDVRAAKQQAEATAKALKLNRVTRFINVLDVGYQSNTSNVEPTQTGFDVTLELPLFDFGSTGNRKAQAHYEAALATVTEVAVQARSETRAAWAQYRAGWDNASRYRDDILPLQQRITDEILLRFNGMLVGPFEVLEQAQQQAEAALRAQDALREFWHAEAQLAATAY